VTLAIRIDPDGSVLEYASGDPLMLARAEFDGFTSVYTMAGMGEPTHVGVVHDFSRTKGMALNHKAWALYARGPICGPMYLWRDDGADLDADDLARLRAPFREMTANDPRLAIKMMQRIVECNATDTVDTRGDPLPPIVWYDPA